MKWRFAGNFSDADLCRLYTLLTDDERDVDEWSIGVIEDLIHSLIHYLKKRAKDGDDPSCRAIASLASQATSAFEELLSKLPPDKFSAHFLAADAIPVMASGKTKNREKIDAILERLKPGALRGVKTKGKQGSSAMSEIAECLQRVIYKRGVGFEAILVKLGHEICDPVRIRKLGEEGALLPRFSRKTVKEWWPHCKRLFQGIYGEEFQDRDEFDSYKTNTKLAGMDDKEKRLYVRKRILDDLQQALRALAVKE